MTQIKASLKRLNGLLAHPRTYFSNPEVTIWDGVIVIVGLFLVTFWQKLVWSEPGSAPMDFWKALGDAAINSLMIWCLFCAFFFALSGFLSKKMNLARLSGLVGSAALPLVFTTLFSALTWQVAIIFGINTNLDYWSIGQLIISWLGLVLSWPGLMGYYLMTDGLKYKQLVAALLVVLMLMFIIVGRFL